MELHLCVVVVVVHAEDLVVGQDVEQLPLALVHEDPLVLPEFLRAPHQGDVDVVDCRTKPEVFIEDNGKHALVLLLPRPGTVCPN